MTDERATNETFVGPLCPHCRKSLRETMRRERISPKSADVAEFPLPVTVLFCGLCGWTFDVAPAAPAPAAPAPFAGRGLEAVASPADEDSLEGQFQIRCRELIGEARALGFNPHVWVSLINALGAVGTAKKLLADHHVLAVTPWLVERHRSDLTVEYEIGQSRWRPLFTDEERAEAANRLAALTGSSS
jgi:hypothetical protein